MGKGRMPRAGPEGVLAGPEDVECTQDVSIPPRAEARVVHAFQQVVHLLAFRIHPWLGYAMVARGAD